MISLSACFRGTRIRSRQDFKQLLINGSLTQAAKCLIQGSHQFVDVFLGSLHGGQAARVFAGQRFGTSLVDRNKKVLPHECRQRLLMATDDLGKVFCRPGEVGQPPSPLSIQRQQVLTDRFISRSGLRAIVEEIQLTVLALVVMRFTFNENLPDERRDGVDGSRHSEKACRHQAGVRQPRVNALADRPDFFFARQNATSALTTKSASTSLNWPTSP